MKIKWGNLFSNEQAQFEKMSELQKYQYFLGLQYGSPYGWGEENPEASDCSGAVCMALYAATGKLIRTTADDLYRRVFTIKSPSPGDIQAAFWITQKAGSHGDREVDTGTATHIAGVVGREVVLSSEEPYAVFSTVTAVPAGGRRVEIRGLDRAAFFRLADTGTVYGLDRRFYEYFEI
jgi:murein DD-endopeptidase